MTLLITENGVTRTLVEDLLYEFEAMLRRSGRDVHVIDTAAARPRLAVDNVREFTPAAKTGPRNLKGTPPYDYPGTN